MKITDFQETNVVKRNEMEEKLESFKLEEIQSKWYFIFAKQKVIMGSKG